MTISRRKNVPVLFLGIVLILVSSCSRRDTDSLLLSGTIEAESVHAGSRIGGRIGEVLIDEGDTVDAGDILFSLETDVLIAERERAEALVAEAEAAYAVVEAGVKEEDIDRARQEAEALRQAWELLKSGPLPEEIAAAESQADSLEAAYRNVQDAADRMENLYEEGVATEREYIASQETASAAYNQWQAALQQVEALKSRPRDEEIEGAHARYLAAVNMVRSLESGSTEEQLAAASARIATAMEGLDRIDLDIQEATVLAPSAGIISSFDLKPGDFITPGQPACEIIEMTELKVVVYIPENRLGFVHEGDVLQFTVDSYPDDVFQGIVDHVAAEAEFTPRNVQVVEERVAQVFAVEISVDNPDGRLRPGMAADVTISLVN